MEIITKVIKRPSEEAMVGNTERLIKREAQVL
jgi:hypothetical protein